MKKDDGDYGHKEEGVNGAMCAAVTARGIVGVCKALVLVSGLGSGKSEVVLRSALMVFVYCMRGVGASLRTESHDRSGMKCTKGNSEP